MAILTAAAPTCAAAQEPPAVPGQVVVRFDPGVGATARTQARRAADVSAVRSSRLPGVQLVKVRRGQTVAAAIRAFERRADVRYAEPNYVYRASAIPNDTDWLQLHGLDQASDADIDAPEAWDVTTGDPNLVVAVVDSGIAYDHEDLAPNVWTNPGEIAGNGMDDDGNGFIDDVHGYDFAAGDPDPRDVNDHGSHVAGTIGAVGNNATGVTGVNWQVKLMAVRVLGAAGFGSDLEIAEGLDYAGDNGARVVNVSLGGPGNSQLLRDAMAAHPDTLYVAAAGNEGENNDVNPSFPCSYTLANVICVAATTDTDGLAFFSNTGATTVDLAAPGTDILSTIPSKVVSLFDDFETDPFDPTTGAWITDGTSPWGWVDTTLGNHLVEDSPGVEYAANADNWIATKAPIPDSDIGCIVIVDGLQFDLEDQITFLDLETSLDGTTWTLQDFLTGTPDLPFEAAFDGAGQDVYMRLQIEANGNTGHHQGVALDDIDVRCAQPAAGDYDSFQGTSMATPHVTGVAALVLAHTPTLTISELRDALLSSGDPLPALAGNTVTGRRLNARNALNPPPSRTPTTGAATGVTTTRATLTGSVNPLGTATGFQFQLGHTTAYGSTSPVWSAGSGVGAQAVSATIGGLAPATTYHYRVVWVRGSERAFGADRTFTTGTTTSPPPPPPPPPPAPLSLDDISVASCRASGRGRRARLRCSLADADALTSARLTLKKGRRTIARATLRPNSRDVLSLKLKRKLKKGRYVVRLKLSDAAGNRRTIKFRVRVR
jgi:subtilisin family serine protease